jgi:hypothetical protein
MPKISKQATLPETHEKMARNSQAGMVSINGDKSDAGIIQGLHGKLAKVRGNTNPDE